MYVSLEEYNDLGFNKVTDDKYLKEASRVIDILTFCRIKKTGWSNLTDYQKELLSEAICEIADFNFENEDLLKTSFNSYNINGISMSFGTGVYLIEKNGCLIPKSISKKIDMTGLTSLLLM